MGSLMLRTNRSKKLQPIDANQQQVSHHDADQRSSARLLVSVNDDVAEQHGVRQPVLLVELAWSWLRFQPDREPSRRYQRRFVAAGKRVGQQPS